MGIENYNQKYGNKYGGQAQLVSSTDGIIPPIFKSLVQFLEFDAGANLRPRYSYRLTAQMSTNEKRNKHIKLTTLMTLFAQIYGLTIKMLFDIPTLNEVTKVRPLKTLMVS